MRSKLQGIACLLALVAPAALGHDTWLLPSGPAAARGAVISVSATSGMQFPALDAAIQPDRIAVARMRLGGQVSEIAGRAKEKHSLRLEAQAAAAGLATIWIESRPKSIDLKPDQVAEYLDEIGATETIGKEWRASGPAARWREIYTKHAKAFVAVGSPTDRSWLEPVGMRLEIVPDMDPTQIQRRQELSVRLLRDGLPVPDFPVGMVSSGSPRGLTRKTDSEGRVRFTPDRKGWILLRATEIRKSDTPDADWNSDFSTLTLWVK